MIEPKQLKTFITKVLKGIAEGEFYCRSMVYLLLLTAAAESDFGSFLRQTNEGRARGIFQVEPHTEYLTWNWCLDNNNALLRELVKASTGEIFGGIDIEGNLKYQIILARANYYSWPHALPHVSDPIDSQSVEKLAEYWKRYWNTYQGKGSVPGAIEKFERFVGYNI
jgi:hypothetical protein